MKNFHKAGLSKSTKTLGFCFYQDHVEMTCYRVVLPAQVMLNSQLLIVSSCDLGIIFGLFLL